METVLKTTNLSKRFGKKYAVENVSISVARGDIYGFIGENGAGKTTVMRMVCGLASPSSGEISLFGSSQLNEQRKKMGSTIENPALYPNLTAYENMEAQRLLLGIKEKNIIEELLELAGISATGRKKAKDFSLGMKQRLMIALSLLGSPDFLVLDEPTNGLDPMGIKEVRDFMYRLNEARGITILVSSHILGELEKIATRYGVISHGKIVDEFNSDELVKRCSKNLVLHTSDFEKTKMLLQENYPNVTYQRRPDFSIALEGMTEEAAKINYLLNTNGVMVDALIPEGENLEDHFLRLMRGAQGNV